MSNVSIGTTLAFDFGEVRIGVSQGDALLGISHPLCTISSEQNDVRFAKISELIKEWQPIQLVVGLPTHNDGQEHALSALCRKFANRLKGRFALPVFLVDEQLTSVIAESLLIEANVFGKKQKPVLDQVAAQAILQTFFEAGGESV